VFNIYFLQWFAVACHVVDRVVLLQMEVVEQTISYIDDLHRYQHRHKWPEMHAIAFRPSISLGSRTVKGTESRDKFF
jgi:hypothetical protein